MRPWPLIGIGRSSLPQGNVQSGPSRRLTGLQHKLHIDIVLVARLEPVRNVARICGLGLDRKGPADPPSRLRCHRRWAEELGKPTLVAHRSCTVDFE